MVSSLLWNAFVLHCTFCSRPSLLEENEVSVYDLKDHPDFQYRPGTVVIRVANFEGEDVNCTAGQVLDNYPEGRVRCLKLLIKYGCDVFQVSF